jgi:hypothetical protein
VNELPHGLPFGIDSDRPEYPVLEGDATREASIVGAGIDERPLARRKVRQRLPVAILQARLQSGRTIGVDLSHRGAST